MNDTAPTQATDGWSRREWMLAVAVVAVAVMGVFAAITLMNDDSSDTDTIAASAEALLDLQYVSLDLRTTLTFPDGDTRFTDSAAALDLENDRAFVDLPGVLRDDTLELVSEGLTLYLTVPDDLRADFPGKRWLSVETDSRARARGAGLGTVPDPTTVMLALAGATGTSDDLGSDTVGDTEVRVVGVDIEPRLMAERLGEDNVASANRLGALSLRWRAEVSLTQADVPVRVVLRADLEDDDGVVAGVLELDLSIGGVNDPVTIGIPPADAVEPVETVAEALRRLGVT